jgi:hypothetical protein
MTQFPYLQNVDAVSIRNDDLQVGVCSPQHVDLISVQKYKWMKCRFNKKDRAIKAGLMYG